MIHETGRNRPSDLKSILAVMVRNDRDIFLVFLQLSKPKEACQRIGVSMDVARPAARAAQMV
jgi:hypothetical protein